MPAWMLSLNTTILTISFFLKWIKDASPDVQPGVIMTDCDQAQIVAIQLIYPQSQVLLCTWHVLHAMKSHFTTNEFPDLWNKIKAWVKTKKLSDFFSLWDEISSDSSVPQSFVQYLAMEWVPSPHMWSKVVQKNWYIFMEGDTNMLTEVYVILCLLLIR